MADGLSLTLAWDWSCGLPNEYLSFALRNILPAWQCRRDVDGLVKLINTSLPPECLEDINVNVLMCGSLFDDAFVPDMVPGGSETGSPNERYENPNGDTTVLLVQKKNKVASPGGENSQRTVGMVATWIPGTDQVEMSIHENDQTLNKLKITHRHEKLAMDGSIIAFECFTALPHLEWPHDAMEWVTRKRQQKGWPNNDMVLDIAAAGCHVVKSTDDPTTITTWSYTFALAEQTLFSSLNNVQKHCFRLLKMVHRFWLLSPGIVTIHHLKMLFFQACERVASEYWTDMNLGACFLFLLDELIIALGTKCLPHYFLSKVNLLKNHDADFLHTLALRITDLRSKPLELLCQINRFCFQPKRLDLADIFKPLIDSARLQSETIHKDAFKMCLFDCTDSLVDVYLENDQICDAAKSLEDLHYFLTLFNCRLLHTPQTYIVLKLPSVDVNKRIKILECLVLMYPHSDLTVSMYDNLGCYHGSKAFREDVEERNKNLEKADEAFQMSMAHCIARGDSCYPPIWTDYANVLCMSGRYNEALSYINAVIDKEKDNIFPQLCNAYDHDEISVVDDNISKEIANHGKVYVLSVVYCFYLMIKAYLELHDRESAEISMERFKKFSLGTFVTGKLNITTMILLGYAYMNLEDYRSAAIEFERILEVDPEHITAKDNKETCKAFLLSLSYPEVETLDLD